MEQQNQEQQLRKGRKYLRLIYLVGGPITFATLIGLFILVVGNISTALYQWELATFIIYYLASVYFMRSIAGVMLLQAFVCISAAAIILYSCLSLIVLHIPLTSAHVTAINIPSPTNWIIAISVVVIYMIYMVRKAFELDISYLQSGFKRIKRYNPYDATYTVFPVTKTMTIFVRKKPNISEHSPLYKKIHAKIDWAFSYLLYFAYIFIPTSPYTLRGVGHGKPLSWIMLLGGLFVALMFGLGAEMFLAFFLTFRRIEKEIGRPLRPIVK